MNPKFAYIKYISSGIALLIGLFGLIGLVRVLGNGIDLTDYKIWTLRGDEEHQDALQSFGSSVNFLLGVVIFGIIGSILAILGFIVYNAILNPKRILLPFAGTVVMVIIFLIGWSMGTGRESYSLVGKSEETAMMIEKVPDFAFYFADAALITVFVVMFMAIAAILVTEVWRRFR
jgi:hypothetical protein